METSWFPEEPRISIPGMPRERLTASGLKVIRVTSVGDDEIRTGDALRRALTSSRFVIVTGGLGSTADDHDL